MEQDKTNNRTGPEDSLEETVGNIFIANYVCTISVICLGVS